MVDLFAGPGGLGEGFARAMSTSSPANPLFRVVLSIEKDAVAHRTLQLRHFFNCFPKGEAPPDYYALLAGDIELQDLFERYPDQASQAARSAWKCELGSEEREKVYERILTARNGEKKWVLVGGPPCQAYSVVGRSRMKKEPEKFASDHRHTLYKEYLRILADHEPPIFVMENVKGILSAQLDGNSTISLITRDLRNPARSVYNSNDGVKYRLYSLSQRGEIERESENASSFVVRAERYGIPQARHRLIIVGIRHDIEHSPRQLLQSEPITVGQIIGDMPRLRSRLSYGEDSADAWKAEMGKAVCQSWPNGGEGEPSVDTWTELELPTISKELSHPSRLAYWLVDDRLKTLCSHESRSHMPSDLHRYMFASWFAQTHHRSPKLSDFPPQLLPNHKSAERDVSGLIKIFSDRFRVQLANRPSTTITSHISKDGHYYIHYDYHQCRSLTVREAARLQTFPDNYHFLGNRTEQYHQVGNAVPPLLSKQIAETIVDVLDAMS